MTAPVTPFLDRATVARFTIDDFPLEPGDEEALQDPHARYALEDALREIVHFENAANEALELWRERRQR